MVLPPGTAIPFKATETLGLKKKKSAFKFLLGSLIVPVNCQAPNWNFFCFFWTPHLTLHSLSNPPSPSSLSPLPPLLLTLYYFSLL